MMTGTSLLLQLFPVLAVAGENVGTESNQYLMITAITALTATIVYLHKSNQAENKSRVAAENLRFDAFVKHHDAVIAKIDEERGAMTAERKERIAMLMELVKQNAIAMDRQATATVELRGAIKEAVEVLHKGVFSGKNNPDSRKIAQ